MIKKALPLGLCLITLLIHISNGMAQTLTSAQQTIITGCAACHGGDGNTTVSQWPKLAGQHTDYFIKEMQDFQKGAQGHRYSTIMSPLVINLNAEDIQALAQYYENLPTKIGAAQADFVKLATKLYQGGDRNRGIPACSACHGPAGEGNPLAKFPRLSGQNSEYTRTQLYAFKQGTRSNDPAGMMRTIASRLTDSEIQALSSYISGLY